jgi:NADH-quinone oxidoreductase subunit L
MGDYSLVWLVLALPLLGAMIQSFFGKAVVDRLGPAKGKRIMGALAVIPIAASFGIGVMLTMKLLGEPAGNRSKVETLFSWIHVASLNVPFEALVDPLSLTMVLVITGIGALIHLYATGYMAEEKDYTRFFSYLNLFVAAMLILVLGNNLALMFIGWEGVGLCSYLLIGFWYKDLANAKAANKAFIVNRIGDWGLTLGMFMLLALMVGNIEKLQAAATDGRWLSYDVILPNALRLLEDNPAIATAIALLFFVGACGKSAQFPLYFWLPDAMAGPTPVSALIHAATMVTAGVFMLNRLHPIFESTMVGSGVIAMVGAFTALFAALIAFGQTDIKKVLAYSTVSQLGFMFVACGVGAYWVGMFHVITHAFFKALLFLGSGAVIHAMAHNQDMRNYGKLMRYLPITFLTMGAGYLAISGFPLLSGFYSKESIIGAALAMDHAAIGPYNAGIFAGYIALFVALLTAMYMTRMMSLTFWGKQERWKLIPAEGHHDDHPPALHDSHEAHAVAIEGNPVSQVGYDHDTHGPDIHKFFYSHEELHAMEHGDHDEHHHHGLDENHKPHEVSFSMWFPLAVLAVLSLGGGWWLSTRLEPWLYPNGLAGVGPVEIHPHGFPLLAVSIVIALGGILLALWLYRKGLSEREGFDLSKWHWFRRSASDQFGYDHAMVSLGVDGGRDVAKATWRFIDVAFIDAIVNGAGWAARAAGSLLRFFQTGYVRAYALMMLAGTVGLLGYLFYLLSRGGGQ